MEHKNEKPTTPDVPVELTVMGATTDEEKKAGEEYNPADHKTVEHPTTYCETFIHLFKGIVGTGILSLPVAFTLSGYVTGVIGIIVATYFTTYSARVLVQCQEEMCKRRRVPDLSYQATTYEAFMEGPSVVRSLSKTALHMCNLLMVLAQIGTSCSYIIFIASNLREIAEAYSDRTFTIREMVMYIVIPIILVSLVRELKYLAPISTLGSITVLGSCGVLFYFMFTDMPSISTREPYGDLLKLPEFFGIVFFATGCISLILPLYNEMKHPQQFIAPLGVLNIGAVLVAILYGIFGFAGYIKYGNDAKASVTLNMPKDHIAAHVVQALLSLANLFSIPLCIYVTYSIFLENYCKEAWKKNELVLGYVVRVSLVVIVVFLSLVIPDLELLISLTGVISYCFLATILPCILNIIVRSPLCTAGGKIFLVSHDLIVILVTFVIFVSGMKSNLQKILILYS